jgi:DNA sulfur modification protein DndB
MYVPNSIPKGPRAKRGQGFPFPGQRFRQGDRIAFNVVLPMTVLSQMIDIDKIGASDNEMNREVKKQHIQSCNLYLDQEPHEFVLGGLVLAAEATQVAFRADDDDANALLDEFDKLYFEACECSSPAKREEMIEKLNDINDRVEVCSGKLWIPYGVRLEVTDGQHRIVTLLERIKRDDKVLIHPSQGIPAMIMIESRVPKRQQDFVDLGQTEPIRPTIKINMDFRQPVTKLVRELVDTVPIFDSHFIEFKRPSIRKSSTNLYSLSNLKTAIQAMLLGNTRLGAGEAQRRLSEKLAGDLYEPTRDVVVDYFSKLSDEVACFRSILEDRDAVDYPKYREDFMCLNSIGLGVMGMVGHDVLLERCSVDAAVEAVAQVDWRRDNPLWEGTLRLGPGVSRGGNVIELGASIVKAAGGLPLLQRDRERLIAVVGLAEKLPPGCLDVAETDDAEPEPVGEAVLASVAGGAK